MFDLLEKLRKKPLHARRRVALVGAGSATAVVFLFWAVAFTMRPQDGMTVGDVLSPLGGLFKSVSTGKDIATDAFQKIVEDATSSAAALAATGTADEENGVLYSGYPGAEGGGPPPYRNGDGEGARAATTTAAGWR